MIENKLFVFVMSSVVSSRIALSIISICFRVFCRRVPYIAECSPSLHNLFINNIELVMQHARCA